MENLLVHLLFNYINLKKKNSGFLRFHLIGFGVSLTAETTTGVFYTCDNHSNIPSPDIEPSVPEDLGIHAANLLLEEIYRGGCASSSYQSLVALWMSLTQKDISKFLIGPLSPYM